MSVLLHLAGSVIVIAGGVGLWRALRRFPVRDLRQADTQMRRTWLRLITGYGWVMLLGSVLLVVDGVERSGLPRWVAVAYAAWAVVGGGLNWAVTPRFVR
jgi:uncharacterized membrane protein